MRTVDVSELEGWALDWAVARAVDHDVVLFNGRLINPARRPNYRHNGWWQPSTDWSQCGPLIDRFQIRFYGTQYLKGRGRGNYIGATIGFAQTISGENAEQWADVGSGSAHLIAACRAIVTAKLGRTVKVPEELL